VSGASPERAFHHLRHTLPIPRLTASGVLALEFSAPMLPETSFTNGCDLHPIGGWLKGAAFRAGPEFQMQQFEHRTN